ncbi:hypothetical protein LEP1GSC151_3233 [Leptospira interrogans serovar Grippotyphosa str. LT2186]|uniref:Uncharacterized protein n=1 Tax=Leptospira interrogans serovar Grippotyphosa str. LT2186 TaxID=1001599 RepID=M3HXR3_LEPIR|nr:hypothetical protein LEP1GSC151_3233 [Leptospira interrogans serovar Grippotyphosa str. LT2186]
MDSSWDWYFDFYFCISAYVFFFLSFWIRNRETLRKAIQAQKTLDQEKNRFFLNNTQIFAIQILRYILILFSETR